MWGVTSSHLGCPRTEPWFTTADSSTTRAISSRQPILLRRYSCLKSPKHQSGKNFVWPTIKNDKVMLLLRPASTLQARYCMTKRFLFCPEIQYTKGCLGVIGVWGIKGWLPELLINSWSTWKNVVQVADAKFPKDEGYRLYWSLIIVHVTLHMQTTSDWIQTGITSPVGQYCMNVPCKCTYCS